MRATRRFPASPGAPGKDRAGETLRPPRNAPFLAARPTIGCCSAAPPEFLSAQVARLGPASARSAAIPQSPFALAAKRQAVGSTTTCRRRSASRRKRRVRRECLAQSLPASGEIRRSPNSASTTLSVPGQKSWIGRVCAIGRGSTSTTQDGGLNSCWEFQWNFTYSKLTGCVLMPRSGGAIHPAIFPRSKTPFMTLCT